MNRITPVLLALILVVLLVLLWQMRPAPVSPYVPIAIEALDAPAIDGPALPEPNLAPDTSTLDISNAPWAGGAGSSADPADASRLPSVEGMDIPSYYRGERLLDPEHQRRLESIQNRIANAASKGDALDPRELSRLLDELSQTEGNELPGGIDLNVLRHNLDVAAQMKDLAAVIESRRQGLDLDDAAMAEHLASELAQLEQLQNQLRIDVVVPAPDAPTQPNPSLPEGSP